MMPQLDASTPRARQPSFSRAPRSHKPPAKPTHLQLQKPLLDDPWVFLAALSGEGFDPPFYRQGVCKIEEIAVPSLGKLTIEPQREVPRYLSADLLPSGLDQPTL